ncbi:MAG: hypothetical protein ACN6OA_18350 [Acinetobacter baumannii]
MFKKPHLLVTIVLTTIMFSTGCNSSPSPQQELNIQANFLPKMLQIDGNTFALANQTSPNDLTMEIFESTLLKATMLKKYEKEAKDNFSLEKDRNPVELNSMCLMTKFLMNKSYIEKAKLNAEFYEDIYGWINKKNELWENILKDTNAGTFKYPCVVKPSNIPG